MADLPTGTVTFLFSDIEHSTRLLQHLGDGYAGVLAAYRELLRTVFQQWDGNEIDTAGDGFFVAFRRATQAVAAAVMAQRALAAYPWPAETSVRVRMGLQLASRSRLLGATSGWISIGPRAFVLQGMGGRSCCPRRRRRSSSMTCQRE